MPDCKFSIVPPPEYNKPTKAGRTYEFKTNPKLSWPCKQTYQIDQQPAQGGSVISDFRLSEMHTDGSVVLTANDDNACAKLTIIRECTDEETDEGCSEDSTIQIGTPPNTSGGFLRKLLMVPALALLIPWWLLAMLAALAAQLRSLVSEGKLSARAADEIWREFRDKLPKWVKWVFDW